MQLSLPLPPSFSLTLLLCFLFFVMDTLKSQQAM